MIGKRKPNVEVKKLREVMDRILAEMSEYGPDSPEYPKLLAHLDRVVVMINSHEKKTITPDAMLQAGCGLTGIVLIILSERIHVITTKAIGFVKKP